MLGWSRKVGIPITVCQWRVRVITCKTPNELNSKTNYRRGLNCREQTGHVNSLWWTTKHPRPTTPAHSDFHEFLFIIYEIMASGLDSLSPRRRVGCVLQVIESRNGQLDCFIVPTCAAWGCCQAWTAETVGQWEHAGRTASSQWRHVTAMAYQTIDKSTVRSKTCPRITRITGSLWGEPPVTGGSPHKGPVMMKAPCSVRWFSQFSMVIETLSTRLISRSCLTGVAFWKKNPGNVTHREICERSFSSPPSTRDGLISTAVVLRVSACFPSLARK